MHIETLSKKAVFEMSVLQQKLISTQTGKSYQEK